MKSAPHFKLVQIKAALSNGQYVWVYIAGVRSPFFITAMEETLDYAVVFTMPSQGTLLVAPEDIVAVRMMDVDHD